MKFLSGGLPKSNPPFTLKGSAEMNEKMLVTLALKYNGDFNIILDAIKNHEDIDYDTVSKYKNELRYKYTTIISNDYPEFLKDTDVPPIVLFYEGNTPL